jgi:hypothetical protein
MHDEHIRIGADHADRGKVSERIVQGLHHGRHDRHLRGRRHDQRVTVRRRARDRLGGQRATGPGPILDHERFAECFSESLGDDARDAVGISPGRKRHDDFDRSLRPALGQSRLGRRNRGNGDERSDKSAHGHDVAPCKCTSTSCNIPCVEIEII